MHIMHLELLTCNLPEQRAFYGDVLGLPITEATPKAFTVQIGASVVTFREAPPDWNGVYHFAFNIPPNQYAEAKNWLAERVALITDADGNAEIFFPHWNAHALYFHDRGGHLAELIARHTLSLSSDVPFSVNSLLSVSEIGIVTESVPQTVEMLQERVGVSVYRGIVNAEFVAVGDENGLFIVVRRGRPWFLDGTPAASAPVKVNVSSEVQPTVVLEFGKLETA